MNIFWCELKIQSKSLVGWSLGISCTVIILISAIYPTFNENMESVVEMLKGFPPEFAAAFGLSNVESFNFSWFYVFINTYTSLFGAIMASGFAIAVFAREKRTKCIDFLYSKPVSRSQIFIQKFLAVLISIVVFNVIYIGACILAYIISNSLLESLPNFIFATTSLFFTQLVFMAIGIAVAVFTKKIRTISSFAAAIGFGGFILTVIYNILKEDILLYMAPMKYFDPFAVLQNHGYDLKLVAVAVIVFVVCVGASYQSVVKSDAHAV